MLTLTQDNAARRGNGFATSIDALRKLPCVQTYKPRSKRYEPKEHHEIATLVRDTFVAHDYKVIDEHYAVVKDGARVMATLKLDAPVLGRSEMQAAAQRVRDRYGFGLRGKELQPGDLALCAYWRHGLDGAWAWTMRVAASVLVCSNGMMIPLDGDGEEERTDVRRKHTTGSADYEDLVEQCVADFGVQSADLAGLRHALIEQDCSDNEGDALIVEAGRRGVLPWARCEEAAQQWHEPNHAEFRDRNRWSLYNAFTEAVKVRTPLLQEQTLARLPSFLVPRLGNSSSN